MVPFLAFQEEISACLKVLEPAQAAVAAGSSSERPSSTLGIYGGIGVPLKGNRGVHRAYTGFIPGLYIRIYGVCKKEYRVCIGAPDL